jgi:hypothetical protein
LDVASFHRTIRGTGTSLSRRLLFAEFENVTEKPSLLRCARPNEKEVATDDHAGANDDR